MTEKSRFVTSIIFMSSMVLTVVCALFVKNALMILILIIIQSGAYFWYSLSYIPYARTCVRNVASRWIKFWENE